jgi:hypothetical protein
MHKTLRELLLLLPFRGVFILFYVGHQLVMGKASKPKSPPCSRPAIGNFYRRGKCIMYPNHFVSLDRGQGFFFFLLFLSVPLKGGEGDSRYITAGTSDDEKSYDDMNEMMTRGQFNSYPILSIFLFDIFIFKALLIHIFFNLILWRL